MIYEDKFPMMEVVRDLDILTDFYAEEFYNLGEYDLEPTLEGFVGKTTNLKMIEECFNRLCDRYRGSDIFSISTADIDGSPEMKEVQKLVCEEFGFHTTEIVVFNKACLNAYTAINSRVLRDITTGCPKMPTEHGQRYYDRDHQLFVYICLYAGLFRKMTGGELTALLLHEIFHCLDLTTTYFIMDVVGWLLCLADPFLFLVKIFGPQISFIRDKIYKIFDYMVLPALLQNIGITAGKYFMMALGPLGGISTLIEFCNMAASKVINDPISIPMGFFGVAMEHFADSGVTAYGYSAEFISAMKKIDEDNIATRSGKLPEFWTMSANAFTWLPLMLLDPHPHVSSRTKNTLLLAKELANDPNMPKSYRKLAMKNYKEAEKAYKKYLDVQEDERERGMLSFVRNCQDKWFPHGIDFRTYFLGMGACATR